MPWMDADCSRPNRLLRVTFSKPRGLIPVRPLGLHGTPLARYPRLVECAIPMTACDDPEFHYEFGVRVFIAGVEAIAADGHRR